MGLWVPLNDHGHMHQHSALRTQDSVFFPCSRTQKGLPDTHLDVLPVVGVHELDAPNALPLALVAVQSICPLQNRNTVPACLVSLGPRDGDPEVKQTEQASTKQPYGKF